jgi:dTDP-4-dehydrorhamnose reductase
VVPSHHDVIPLTHSELDVGEYGAVMRTILRIQPDLVLNFAAFTAVDENERDPLRAARDNTLGPANLAMASRDCDAAMLHVSTDYVFDGEQADPYDELSDPRPLSVYGRSKLAGERAVERLLPRSFIVRTGYVFGGGNDYLTTAIGALARGEAVGGVADRIGTPTYVVHLAERLLPIALSGRYGAFHLGGPEPATWFDVLERVKALGGFSGDVYKQTSAELGLPAPRPTNSALTSVFVPHLGIPQMPSLDDGLRCMLG